MRRSLVSLVLVSGLSFSVFLVAGGDVAEQTAYLADGGYAPNRDCVCPVRLDPDFAADAGLRIYQRAKLPCVLTVLSDGGRDIQLPPMPVQRVRQAIDVVSWDDCTLSASTAPVRALWGANRPFTSAGVVKPWCRQRTDAGLPCALLDGGTFGDRNVSPCATRANPATCERVSSGVIILGDDEEDL